MSRPDLPRLSLATLASLIFAPSKVFCNSGLPGYKMMKDNVGPRRLACPCHQTELARAELSILDLSQFLAIAIQRQSLADTIGLQMVGSLTLADGGARLHLAPRQDGHRVILDLLNVKEPVARDQ